MKTTIKYSCKILKKEYEKEYNEILNAQSLQEWITIQKSILDNSSGYSFKAFIVKQNNQSQFQYIKLNKTHAINSYLNLLNGKNINVEFFLEDKKLHVDLLAKQIKQNLQSTEGQLRLMVNELKDEVNQSYALEVINKKSSRTIDVQYNIFVHLVVCDPLVDQNKIEPLYYEEINIPDHIQRIKRASMSQSDLNIKAVRQYGSIQNILKIFNHQNVKDNKRIDIMQIFTHVVRKNEVLMISLEGKFGEQVWHPAQKLLKDNTFVDLLIVIGVGANLLEQINYSKPMILISTISLEQKKFFTIQNKRSVLDTEHSYNDQFCQSFLEHFYQGIFKRIPIGQSFEDSKKTFAKLGEKSLWCCCLHEHQDGCNWPKIIRKIGCFEAHRFFKHNFENYKKENNFEFSNQLQKFLLNNEEQCSNWTVCCRSKKSIQNKKKEVDKILLHHQIDNIIIWNKRNYDFFTGTQNNNDHLNRFQCEDYDKPLGRKRPLLIYQLINKILSAQKLVLIIRSTQISDSKRYLKYAKEYILNRNKDIHFITLQIERQYEKNQQIQFIENRLKQLKKEYDKSTGKNQIASIDCYVCITYNPEKHDRYYNKLFSQIEKDFYNLDSLSQKYLIKIKKLRFLFVNNYPNFDDIYPVFKIQQPSAIQKYQLVVYKYTYDQVKNNFYDIQRQILQIKAIDQQQIEIYCDNILYQSQQIYYFLGFLAQFNQDGFFLTKSSKIILDHLFDSQIVNKALTNQLPVEFINLHDSVHLLLKKSHFNYFKNNNNGFRHIFYRKVLQFYFILFRCYVQLCPNFDKVPYNKILKLIQHQQGLFSINIQNQDDIYKYVEMYNKKVEKCKEQILQSQQKENIMYNPVNFRLLYHLNQVQKILHEVTKKKKNSYAATSKSIIRNVEPFVNHYLLWNVLHKMWIVLLTIQKGYQNKKAHFQTVLLLFLIRVQITHPFTEVARLQLYLMLNKDSPKCDQTIIKSSKMMIKLLNYLRTYAHQQNNLANLQLAWGNTIKIKELLNNCPRIVQMIIQILQYIESQPQSQTANQFHQNKMFLSCTIQKWLKQTLKIIQKKVRYYFSYSKMLKQMRTKESKQEIQKQFNKQFKLKQLSYEFKTLRNRINQKDRDEPEILLINHYLDVLMHISDVDHNILKAVNGKISSQFKPIFDHLCDKIYHKTLFNQKDLIICARSRSILFSGKSYLVCRKRNLTMIYLTEIIKQMALKISYFNLTPNTLRVLQANHINNNQCEMLVLMLAIDSPEEDFIYFGQEQNIDLKKVHIKEFNEDLKRCNINILIINGQNSIRVCQKLIKMNIKWENKPNIIAIQNNKYFLSDEKFNRYGNSQFKEGEKVWSYLCNEVSQISLDMLMISIVSNINNQLIQKKLTYTEKMLRQQIRKALIIIQKILSDQFQCAQGVLSQIKFQVWVNSRPIQKISEGKFENLTTKFYISEHNLHDQDYYENIGRGKQVYDIIRAMTVQGKRLIQIIGPRKVGKSVILQEVCWLSQIKSLFKFGVFKFNLGDKYVDLNSFQNFIRDRSFKTITNIKATQSGILIALDNVDEDFLLHHHQLIKKLKSKQVTIIYSVKKPQTGLAFRQILAQHDMISISITPNDLDHIYAILMSNIKQFRCNQAYIQNDEIIPKYTKEEIKLYENKVSQIMIRIQKEDLHNKLQKAMELLEEKKPVKQSQKTKRFLNFYKQNFQKLMNSLRNIRQLKIKIVD